MKKIRLPGLMDLANLMTKLPGVDNSPEAMKEMMSSSQMKYVAYILDLLELNFKFGNLPIIRRFHPWVQDHANKCYPIPINQDLERGEDVVLPYQAIEELIEKSSHRVIMDICGCRTAYQCENHRKDVGCLMMGEDSKLINIPFARQATKQEAREHLKKAIDNNLPPFIGKSIIDNFIFSVPDRGRLFTVCFCCDCCCVGRMYKHMPAKKRNVQMNKLEGLEVYVDRKKCSGCGQCVEHCFLDCIQMSGKLAHISIDCRGCGRCLHHCPEDAIRMELENPNFVHELLTSLETHVKVD